MDSVLTMPRPTDIEPWVDSQAVASHLGFEADHIRKLANSGIIPGVVLPGRRRYWRFKLSQVDRAWAAIGASEMSPVADSKKGATK